MGTLFVDKLDPQSGTSLEIGSSGDTMTVPSGATFNVAGTLQSGGVSVANSPAFLMQKSSAQTITQNSTTKLTFGNEIYNTGAFASDKFTVPSGQAGKYIFYLNAMIMNLTADAYIQLYLYKNGSEYQSVPVAINYNNPATSDGWASYTISVNASVSDYFESYVRHNATASKDTGTKNRCYFGGFKLIGI